MIRILFQDEHLVAIDKPAGMHVHPHEDRRHRARKEQILLYVLRDQLNRFLYPVHRLDVSTSGVLIFALSKESARNLCEQFALQSVQKKYWAIARGYSREVSRRLDIPLALDSTNELVPAATTITTIRQQEIPVAVGKKFASARYTWLECHPHSVRFHQIRRHLNRISMPIIGDPYHGDSHHNRFFRERLGIAGLCLRSVEMSCQHPKSDERISFSAQEDLPQNWLRISQLFASQNPLQFLDNSPPQEHE